MNFQSRQTQALNLENYYRKYLESKKDLVSVAHAIMNSCGKETSMTQDDPRTAYCNARETLKNKMFEETIKDGETK